MSRPEDSRTSRGTRWYLKEREPDAGPGWQVLAFLALLILASGATSLVFGFWPYFAASDRYENETLSEYHARQRAVENERPNAFRDRLLFGLAAGTVGSTIGWFVVRSRIREEESNESRD